MKGYGYIIIAIAIIAIITMVAQKNKSTAKEINLEKDKEVKFDNLKIKLLQVWIPPSYNQGSEYILISVENGKEKEEIKLEGIPNPPNEKKFQAYKLSLVKINSFSSDGSGEAIIRIEKEEHTSKVINGRI